MPGTDGTSLDTVGDVSIYAWPIRLLLKLGPAFFQSPSDCLGGQKGFC